jgi:hypothetical protein
MELDLVALGFPCLLAHIDEKLPDSVWKVQYLLGINAFEPRMDAPEPTGASKRLQQNLGP